MAKLEARANVNPALRPPSKPPAKPNTPVINPTAKMLWAPLEEFDFLIYYDCQEIHSAPHDEIFYDCQEPPELKHKISDTGDITPTLRTWPCQHMWRTMRAMRVPLMQSNRYANWVRCPLCGHTHATTTYSATCCLGCKGRNNDMVNDFKCQSHQQWLSQQTQPPIDAVDVARNCPWTRWGMLLSQFLFRMTPSYRKPIAQAQRELNAKRLRDLQRPWGEQTPRLESSTTVSAVVHLGSLKAKVSDEHYCMLDSGANVLVIPWKPGMKGEKTMCTLVGDNKPEGLIVSKLYTHSRVHLIVAVKEA